MVAIKVKHIRNNFVPVRQHEGDSGYDITAIEELVLLPHSSGIVKTGLAFEIPNGYELQVRSRSGLAAKHDISVLNAPGTIDSSFRGEVSVIIRNHGNSAFTVRKGTRIAQLVAQKVESIEFVSVEELTQSERGENGTGSTGLT